MINRRFEVVTLLLGTFAACLLWQNKRAVATCMVNNDNTDTDTLPLVINTWPFTEATKRAWEVLINEGGSPMDALEKGCNVCEDQKCSDSVGYGGHPDEQGETTLDAMVMDGDSHDAGGVASLRRVKRAISVARAVLEYSKHTLLAGDQATEFATEMGFKEESLSTNSSTDTWKNWKEVKHCQPNYRMNVIPDPSTSCGPYQPKNNQTSVKSIQTNRPPTGPENHDTIGMIVIGQNGSVVGGTTTNGLQFKIPGRVADSPLVGAGAYCLKDVGGAAATGDGDIMMRFLPSYQAVESMRLGETPSDAAKDAIGRIIPYYPTFSGAVIAANTKGEHGASCYGMETFTYSIFNPSSKGNVTLLTIPCLTGPRISLQ